MVPRFPLPRFQSPRSHASRTTRLHHRCLCCVHFCTVYSAAAWWRQMTI